MFSRGFVRSNLIALTIPAVTIGLLLLFSLSACGAESGASPPANQTTTPVFNPSDGILAITQAEPNVPTDGREPWLGSDAWIKAVQAGQEYVGKNPGPQNVQILTGMSTAGVWVYMVQHVSGALGVSCQYCHDITNFAADPYPQKISARLMLRLVRDLNSQFVSQVPDWKGNYVQCATCHYGQSVNMLAYSEQNAYQSEPGDNGETQQTQAVDIDTYAVHPDSQFVAQHPSTGKMLEMVNWMETRWSGYVLPRMGDQVIEEPPPLNDRRHYVNYDGTYYSVPNCYTCHKGNQIPPADINREALDKAEDKGGTLLPFVLRQAPPPVPTVQTTPTVQNP